MTQKKTIIHPFLPIGPEAVVSVIQELGAIAFPVMSEADALYLSRAADELRYEKQAESYGPRQVRQEVSSCMLSPGNILWDVADQLECSLAMFFYPQAFESPLSFTHRNVQRYVDGSLGIEPHYDESTNRNIIVLLGLRGTGLFTVYESLDGPVIVQWQIRPGTLLLMKAPGFYGCTPRERPPHGVTKITGDPYRDILGLRQEVPKGENAC